MGALSYNLNSIAIFRRIRLALLPWIMQKNLLRISLSVLLSASMLAGTAQALPAGFEEPKNEMERMTLVNHLMAQKFYTDALKQIEIGLADNPKNVQLMFKRAVTYERMGRIKRAKALLEDLIQHYPEIVEPYNNLAVIYANEGNTTRALTLLQRAVTINPRFALAHENLGDIYLDKAVAHYRDAVTAKPDNKRMQRKLQSAQRLLH